jgi:hypothetical protein
MLYTNSCSFGAPQEHPIYADFIGKQLGLKVINAGVPGSCNRRIIRTTLRDLSNKNGIALIGLTFISRTELWQPKLANNSNDGDFHSIDIEQTGLNWQQGLIKTIVPDVYKYANSDVLDYYKQWLLHYNPESELTNLLTDIILLSGWLTLNNIKHLIFSNVDVLPTVDFNAPFIKSLHASILENKNIIDPWSFSFGTYALSCGHKPKDYHLYGVHGHPGEQAHQEFSQYLLEKLNV